MRVVGQTYKSSPVTGGGAPPALSEAEGSYGAEGEGFKKDGSDSDVGSGELSTAAFPLRPFRPPPPITGEEHEGPGR